MDYFVYLGLGWKAQSSISGNIRIVLILELESPFPEISGIFFGMDFFCFFRAWAYKVRQGALNNTISSLFSNQIHGLLNDIGSNDEEDMGNLNE